MLKGAVRSACEMSQLRHLDKPVILLKIHVRCSRPARFSPPVHKPRPLNDLPQLIVHLILELGHHLQDLISVVVAASTTKHEQPEGVYEPHEPSIFIPDGVGENPEGQCIPYEEFAVLQDVIIGAERVIRPKCHCVLINDGLNDNVELRPFWLPPIKLLEGVKLEDDPNKTSCQQAIFGWNHRCPNRVMSSKRVVSECSMSSRAWW